MEDGVKHFQTKNSIITILNAETRLKNPTININKKLDLEEEMMVVKEVKENNKSGIETF
ncbi:hypothetical protein CWI38_2014p0020 [Hamiltosporidium tvaerminnensis]|uniref:Uncharacterized protein n=1 Tax=Hamiltosporidium tvaerminnensis TaxID=1176355 RepID=A0A4Q9LRL4_9MICR|nr:hypothetical protein CWI38_2014p0020 [Hamiltosporidium tvaerminnensis]